MKLRGAYVTLLTKAPYLPGTLVLDHGLRAVGSQYPLVVMVTSSLSDAAKAVLHNRGIITRKIDSLHPKKGNHALAAHDERFADTWSKLRCALYPIYQKITTDNVGHGNRGFGLTEYDRIVLLDSDMIVMKNMDELMDLDLPKDEIAATHVCACNPRKLEHYPADWIPANCAHTANVHPLSLPPSSTDTTPRPYSQLNSGTVVLNPSEELSQAIVDFLLTHDKISEFSFPDQDLLTAFFKGKWKPLPWYYNALKTLRFIHPNEWRDEEVRCLHYILPDKPWQSRVTPAGLQPDLGILNSWWWQQFDHLREGLMTSDPEGWNLVLSNVDTRTGV